MITKENDDRVKVGFKDKIAIMIAVFQVVMPIVLIALIIVGVVLLLLTKFWIKS